MQSMKMNNVSRDGKGDLPPSTTAQKREGIKKDPARMLEIIDFKM